MGPRILARLLRDESGQDTIEYVLVTAGIGVVTIATWPLIEASIAFAYRALDTQTHNLWEPNNPVGGS